MKLKYISLITLTTILSLLTISIAPNLAKATSYYDENTYWETEYEYLKYFDENLTQRYSSSTNEKKAATYISEELKTFGYEPDIRDFSFELYDQKYYSQNVSARKTGLSSDKQIIIGAHYDSVQTSGITDNASGVALVLTYARLIKNIDTNFDIEFVFFGSEELGMEGSKFYVDQMSNDEIKNTIVMINADAILAGTYRYVYGGTAVKFGIIKDAWGAYLARNLSNSMNLDIRLNDTELSTYKTPTGVQHSDHAPFQNAGIPYIYFESTNWELPDDPNNPEKGSTGDYETEIGRVMHDKERDNLQFILTTFDKRAENNMKAYSKLLPKLVEQISISKKRMLTSATIALNFLFLLLGTLFLSLKILDK